MEYENDNGISPATNEQANLLIKSASRLLSFNTGRGYGAGGQRVIAGVIGESKGPSILDDYLEVVFVDLDRDIIGKCYLYAADALSQADVMSAYDRGAYQDFFLDESMVIAPERKLGFEFGNPVVVL